MNRLKPPSQGLAQFISRFNLPRVCPKLQTLKVDILSQSVVALISDIDRLRNPAENLLELEVKYTEDPWTDDISRFYGEDKRPIEIRSTGPY